MNSITDMVITDIKQPFTVHFPRGKTTKKANRSDYGLSLCIRGQITYTIDGKTHVSDPDHAVLLPKGKTYTLHGDKDGLFPLINFQCKNLAFDNIIVLPLKNSKQCIADLEAIKSMFLFKESNLKIYASFYELLNSIFMQQQPTYDLLYPAIAYIEENISDPMLSNAILADRINISEVYLRRLFLNQFDTTPKQYILDIRISKAKQQLLDTPLTVTAISEACGFASVYHFCRAFKKHTGTTPTQYAKLNKKYKI